MPKVPSADPQRPVPQVDPKFLAMAAAVQPLSIKPTREIQEWAVGTDPKLISQFDAMLRQGLITKQDYRKAQSDPRQFGTILTGPRAEELKGDYR